MKKIEKKAYAVLQDALLEKDGTGAYKVVDMAKEGMTTLKKHATKVVVICTDSSEEDVKSLLDKGEVPYDKVIKLDDDFDFFVFGNDKGVKSYSWPSVLDDIGYQLTKKPDKEEDRQKQSDSSLERWFKKQEKDYTL